MKSCWIGGGSILIRHSLVVWQSISWWSVASKWVMTMSNHSCLWKFDSCDKNSSSAYSAPFNPQHSMSRQTFSMKTTKKKKNKKWLCHHPTTVENHLSLTFILSLSRFFLFPSSLFNVVRSSTEKIRLDVRKKESQEHKPAVVIAAVDEDSDESDDEDVDDEEDSVGGGLSVERPSISWERLTESSCSIAVARSSSSLWERTAWRCWKKKNNKIDQQKQGMQRRTYTGHDLFAHGVLRIKS